MNVSNSIKQLERLVEGGDKLFIVMIGVPGSGKSTWTRAFIEALKDVEVVIASTDDLIDELAAKKGITYSEAFKQLDWKWANAKFKLAYTGAAKDGKHCIIDRTNMNKKNRKVYLEAAKYKSHKLVALNFTLDDKELERRLKTRADETGKVIPAFVMKDMFSRYQAPTRDEGFDVIIEVQS